MHLCLHVHSYLRSLLTSCEAPPYCFAYSLQAQCLCLSHDIMTFIFVIIALSSPVHHSKIDDVLTSFWFTLQAAEVPGSRAERRFAAQLWAYQCLLFTEGRRRSFAQSQQELVIVLNVQRSPMFVCLDLPFGKQALML